MSKYDLSKTRMKQLLERYNSGLGGVLPTDEQLISLLGKNITITRDEENVFVTFPFKIFDSAKMRDNAKGKKIDKILYQNFITANCETDDFTLTIY